MLSNSGLPPIRKRVRITGQLTILDPKFEYLKLSGLYLRQIQVKYLD
ncbi:MAG: hypothetical protein GF330_01465 [Candidatus Eisenbacteria bacterium]|nr:hypothetical protein [Candidatus Eisenbacteria bacterium]